MCREKWILTKGFSSFPPPPKLLSQSQAAVCHPQVNTITARVFLWVMHTTQDGSEAMTDSVVSDVWPLCRIRLRSADPRRLFSSMVSLLTKQ